MSAERPTSPVSASDREDTLATVRALRGGDIDPIDFRGQVGRYLILRKIASGGMGVLYHARDEKLDREVALKCIRSEHARQYEADGGEARLLRESQALARLRHPNVITLHEIERLRGRLVVVMEYFDGVSMAQWLREQRPGLRRVLAVTRAAASALASAHAVGLVHRDIKPENILVGDDDQVRLVDFGLAQLGPHAPDRDHLGPQSLLSSRITLRGFRFGTFEYMAPEAASGVCTPASDQYALSVVLFEALFGSDAARARADGDPVPRRRPGGESVPARVRAALARGVHPSPTERFPNIGDWSRTIEPRNTRRQWWFASVVAAGAFGVLGAMAVSEPPPQRPSCARVGDRVGEAWNPARADAIVSRFESTAGELGAATWTRVEPKLRDYATQLAMAAAQQCVSDTPPSGASSVCLDDRHAALDSVLARFQSADQSTVLHAVEAVDALPPVTACFDAGVTGSDPQALVDARRFLLQAELARASGDYDGAAHLLRSKTAELDALARPEIDAQRHRLRGQIALDRGHPDQATRSFREGLRFAERSGDDALRVALWLDLTLALGPGEKKLSAARETLAAADVARVAQTDPASKRRRDWVEAELCLAEHDYRRARTLFAGLVETAPQLDQARLAFGLARAVEGAGETWRVDFLELYERAWERASEQYGSGHPTTLRVALELARRQGRQGRFDEARTLLDRGHHAAATLGEHGAFLVVEFTAARGKLAIHEGDYPRAVDELTRAIDDWERVRGQHDFDEATTHSALGVAHSRMGNLDAALASQARARRLLEGSVGPDHPRLLGPIVNTASAYSRASRLQEAALAYEQAMRLSWRAGVGNQRLYALEAVVHRIDGGQYDAAEALLDELLTRPDADIYRPFVQMLRAEAQLDRGPKPPAFLDGPCEAMHMRLEYAERFQARCYFTAARIAQARGDGATATREYERAATLIRRETD